MQRFGKISIIFLAGVALLGMLFGSSGAALAATAINLGTAANFAVLGGSTITNTGSTVVNGDLGLSPGTSVTGFPPGMINGAEHLTDPAAAQAQTDLVTAFNAAGSQTGAIIVSGDLGGRTLAPGIYNSASSLGLTGALTLDGQGNPNAVFIFQIGSALTTASTSRVNLINGAQACNVFWQVNSSATLGTNSNFAGSVLALTSITATTGAVINGRMLARTGAVTLDTNSVSRPSCAAPVVPPVVIPPTVPPTVVPPVVTLPPVLAVVPPVIVTPTLPNTGFSPDNKKNIPWNIIIPAGIFIGLFSLYLIRRKQKI